MGQQESAVWGFEFYFTKIEKDTYKLVVVRGQSASDSYFYLMAQHYSLLKYISWLSIDVVFGAMAGMLFFEELFHVNLHWPAYMLLALAVWSIYTLDHLLDISKKAESLSERRAFHLANWKTLLVLLLLAFIWGLMGAFWWFGWGRELQMTLILAVLILGSNLIIRKAGQGWMKELSIALFYVVGIVWLPLLRAASVDLDWRLLIFIPLYVSVGFLNLLMLSFLDQDEDQKNGFFSAVSTLAPIQLVQWIRILGLAIIFASLAAFILFSSFHRPFACVMLLMSLVHYLTFFQAGLSSDQKRMYMEASFMLPALVFLL